MGVSKGEGDCDPLQDACHGENESHCRIGGFRNDKSVRARIIPCEYGHIDLSHTSRVILEHWC